ncbi:XRE family transcriptional regulator [Marinicauda algicola]|uniref:XRE family transcriptional regulator n=1 Tax=Marinicauda algicola TaxID=2029849 RepID=A0A4S2GZ14_9PROT|nr:XRE family transcriptional regulator [Marinicauda algicola]
MTLELPNPVLEAYAPVGLPRRLFQRRKRLGLSMGEAGDRLGVTRDVIRMWERGEREPRARYIPAIIDFFDDDAWLASDTFADRLKRFRLLRGWSQKRFGTWLGYSERSIGRWEDGQFPPRAVQARIEERIRAPSLAEAAQREGPGKRSTIGRRPQTGLSSSAHCPKGHASSDERY